MVGLMLVYPRKVSSKLKYLIMEKNFIVYLQFFNDTMHHNVNQLLRKQLKHDCDNYLPKFSQAHRLACDFQNLVGISVNATPQVGIGLRWLQKLGVDMSPRPHAHRRA